ncbi:hypothetical protein LP7551_04463 [Roseibium album]|nr:hypothetical protein LP7551_04463 [Roseibium album]
MAEETSASNCKIQLRLASCQDDLDALRPLSTAFHQESRFSKVPYSFDKRDALFQRALDTPDFSALIIAERQGKPVGFLFCTVGEYIVGTGDLFTTIHSFYISKDLRNTLASGRAATRLIKSAIKWSKMRQVQEIMVHVTSGLDLKRTDRFFRHAGFEVIGGNYALALSARPGARE